MGFALRPSVRNGRTARREVERRRRRRNKKLRLALGVAAAAFSLSSIDQAQGQGYGGEAATAWDNDWALDLDSGNLHYWAAGQTSTSSNTIFPNHMFTQEFFFRVDSPNPGSGYDDREYRIFDLTLNEVSNWDPATGNYQADKIFADYGGGDGEPIQVEVTYDLDGSAAGQPQASSITKTVRITNTSPGDLNLDFFLYTDLDMDTLTSNVGQFMPSNSIRQQSGAGSIVDVTVTSGPNPTAFSMREYPSLLDEFDDASPTFTLDNQANVLGPTDVTHAFEWDLNTLGTSSSVEIQIVTGGTFSTIVGPDNSGDPNDPSDGFSFDDDLPPSAGDPPRWYDPIVAVGYDYELTSGENAFAELYLPAGFTDGQYVLTILDPDHDMYNQQILVSGDGSSLSYDFIANDNEGDGVRLFRITGIEEEAGIDPENELGFPTGLTFVNGNAIQFTQSPITVPEPASLTLLALGAGMLLRQRRRA